MIGIFDSGVGGLTVMRAIRDVLPSSDIVYFGDTKNAPYGAKNREELSTYMVDAIKLLREHGANRLVSACNSLSVSLVVSLFDAFSIAPSEVIEMVGPTVSYLRNTDARIALAATPATIRSGMYQNAFRMVGKEASFIEIPDLAGAIESGASDDTVRSIIKKAFSGTSHDFDVLVLACTHYPLVHGVFKDVLGENVTIFDPAVAVAERAEKRFWPQEAADGRTHFLVSQESETFREIANALFPESNYSIEVVS